MEDDCGISGGAELAHEGAGEEWVEGGAAAASCCFMASQGLSVGSSGGAGDAGLSEFGAAAVVVAEAMELAVSAADCENVCCQREAVLQPVSATC